MKRIRSSLAKCTPLKTAYHRLLLAVMSAVYHMSPELLARSRYLAAWGRWPDFKNPITFDEKLLWLNLYWRHPLKSECADKYMLREYVNRQGLSYLLPRIYKVYDAVDLIDFGVLPERFVLKCSHGCKCNVFCWNKHDLDFPSVRRDLTRWMSTDYSKTFGELHYEGMKPRILCEELLDAGTGQLPADYKVFCFNGRPCWILYCYNRSPNDKGHRALMDLNWNPVMRYLYDGVGPRPPLPSALPDLLEAAKRLSAPFPFVRIDFYCINGRAVIGEMTFTPNACINKTYTRYAQQEMGRRLELPQPFAE